MTLSLPDPQLPGNAQDALESIQRNFEALAAERGSDTATATYQNSAIAATPALTARKYPNGQVVLSGGVAKLTGFSTGTTYATLPAGYRPAATMRVAVGIPINTLDPATAVIDTDGTVELLGASVGVSMIAFYLDGITFHSE